jgi:hypothetical protein
VIVYRHADTRLPFLWESSEQPAARWHGDGEGPVQYFSATPDGAWAEFLRHEEITEPSDLEGVRRAMSRKRSRAALEAHRVRFVEGARHGLFRELDIPSTYANIITSMNLDGGAIPMVMNTEQEAIQLAVKTVVRVKPRDCRIVRIRNTLELAQIQVSEPLLAEVRARPDRFQIASPPAPWTPTPASRITTPWSGSRGSEWTST